MLQRTGEAETITTHYLFALGLYRALYIPNWLYRYFAEGYVDPIPWVAGMIQTILYSDFFWIYYTKYVVTRHLSDYWLYRHHVLSIRRFLFFLGGRDVNGVDYMLTFPIYRVLQGKKFNLPV